MLTTAAIIGLGKFAFTGVMGHLKDKRNSKEFGAFAVMELSDASALVTSMAQDVEDAIAAKKPIADSDLRVHQRDLAYAARSIQRVLMLMGADISKDTDGDGTPDVVDSSPRDPNEH